MRALKLDPERHMILVSKCCQNRSAQCNCKKTKSIVCGKHALMLSESLLNKFTYLENLFDYLDGIYNGPISHLGLHFCY